MVLKKFIRPTKVVRGFTLEPDHTELINRESARRRLNNDSMTLRQLLDEWAKWEKLRLEAEETPPTPGGKTNASI